MELGPDFKKPTSLGNWYALQFQAVTAVVLADSRLDPSAARGLLNNFKEELCENNLDFCQDPTLDIDTAEISKIVIRLSNEYGSEFNKIELPVVISANQCSINDESLNFEKSDTLDKPHDLHPEKVDLEQQIQPQKMKSAAALYTQKRNNRLRRENAQKKKKILIGAIIIFLIILAILWMIFYH